jgi:hypothetical protein
MQIREQRAMENIYKIKRAFLIPLISIIVLLFLLFVISVFKGQMLEIISLATFFIISLAVGIETVKREIVINANGLTIKKFFRRKEFVWTEITHLAIVALKKKVYFLLTTTKGFYIFSNLFENHALLIRDLVGRLDDEKVEVEIKKYLDHPVERRSIVVMSWATVVVIAAIIILKLSGI